MIRCSMTRLLGMRLGAGPSSATLVNLHIVRRVALSQANIWSRNVQPRDISSSTRRSRRDTLGGVDYFLVCDDSELNIVSRSVLDVTLRPAQ